MGLVIVFDLYDAKSFERIKYWLDNINLNIDEQSKIQKIVIANKCDREGER